MQSLILHQPQVELDDICLHNELVTRTTGCIDTHFLFHFVVAFLCSDSNNISDRCSYYSMVGESKMNRETMENELLPCPFCGVTPSPESNVHGTQYEIECWECDNRYSKRRKR